MNQRKLRAISRAAADEFQYNLDRLQKNQKRRCDFSLFSTDELIVYRALWNKLHGDPEHLASADLLSETMGRLCHLAAFASADPDSSDYRRLNNAERAEFERLEKNIRVVSPNDIQPSSE